MTGMYMPTHKGKPKWFLYEIVANKRNGIDCDKFDYFARDSANVGVKSNFDYRRYFENIRILLINNQLRICVRDKEMFNLYQLFHTRWSLHYRVYQHKTKASIEDLLLRAFEKADKILKISKGITKEGFTLLTDKVMYDIFSRKGKDRESQKLLKEAQELLKRIQCRDLYKFCGETQPETKQSLNKKKISEEIAAISDKKLNAEDIFVDIVSMDFGMKDKNPISKVVFITKSGEPFISRQEDVSKILPQKFNERYVRVYTKSRDVNSEQLLRQCFKSWCSVNGYPLRQMLERDGDGYCLPLQLNSSTDPQVVCKRQRSMSF